MTYFFLWPELHKSVNFCTFCGVYNCWWKCVNLNLSFDGGFHKENRIDNAYSGINLAIYFSVAQQHIVVQGLFIIEASRSHSDAPHWVWSLWTRDRPVAETSSWQHTTLTRDRHPWFPVGFEPTIPSSERRHTHALDRVATGIVS